MIDAPNRNNNCPCGSGKKFKFCCGKKNKSITSRLDVKDISVISYLLTHHNIQSAIDYANQLKTKQPSIELELYLLFLHLKNDDYAYVAKAKNFLSQSRNHCDIVEKIFGRLTNVRRFDFLVELYKVLDGQCKGKNIELLCIQAQIQLGQALNATTKIFEMLGNTKNLLLIETLFNLSFMGKMNNVAIICAEKYFGQIKNKRPVNMMLKYGMALAKDNKRTQALEIFGKVELHHPGDLEISLTLVSALIDCGDLVQAERILNTQKISPRQTKEVITLYCKILAQLGRGYELLEFIKNVIQRHADHLWAQTLYAKYLQMLGANQERLCFLEEKIKETNSPQLNFLESYAMSILYENDIAEDIVRRSQAEVASAHKNSNAIKHDWQNKKIRIGYVSSDFNSHSVFYFIEPVLKSHNKDLVEVYAYYNGNKYDGKTDEIKRLVDHWSPIHFLNTSSAVQKIREDKIDVLVDLNGYTRGNRLDIFACKPAKYQGTWIGYPATTAMAAIDFRVSDDGIDNTQKSNDCFSEKLLEIRSDFFSVYSPPKNAPAVSEAPSRHNRFITFGSFNNFNKLNSEALYLWASILSEVPNSRMLIKNRSVKFDLVKDNIIGSFNAFHIDVERIKFIDWDISSEQHYSRYAEIDLMLDTFPYNGTTTTCESLWMGVPVISFDGNSHRSRVSARIMKAIGLPDFVASSLQSYKAVAIEAAKSPSRLCELRHALRTKMSESDLMDYKGFTEKLENAYVDMVRKNED